jgi:hypothetical protein
MDASAAVYPMVFYAIVFAGVGLVVGFFVEQKGALLAIVGAMSIAVAAMNAFLAPGDLAAQAGLGAFVFAGLVMATIALIVNALRKWES